MTTQGWIFMVGLRVFDLGALVVWLVWFYRLRDDGDDSGDDKGGGSGPPEPQPEPGGPIGGLELPKPDAAPWPHRRRDHTGDLTPEPAPARRSPRPEPQRVPTRLR
jgi:hypothetical protein